ncbi:MAG: ABC transporter ATP-binding protein, partial [Lachnospiraceae bacterium]
ALDYKTDAALRKAIAENYKDTTTIIIAQRISSIMNADKIIVMDDGKMIGFGNHKYLMDHCDIYREISQSQMGGDTE